MDASDFLLFSRDPLLLRPHAAVSETFNDNIFYSESAEAESDFITTLSPGLTVQVGREEDNHLSLDYTYSHFFYADRDDLNTGEHLVRHDSLLEWSRLRLEGLDEFSLLSRPIGQAERARVGRRNVERLVFRDNYRLTYVISHKTSVYGEVTHDTVDWEEDTPLFDQTNLSGTFGFGFQFSPRLTLFGEGYYGVTSSEFNLTRESPPDSQFFGGFLGARGDFTDRLTGVAKVGYEVREFEDNTPGPAQPVVEASLTQRFSEKRALTLDYRRRTYVSVEFGRYSYTQDSVGLSFFQALGNSDKLEARAGGSFAFRSYEETDNFADRSDSYYQAYFDLTYNIQLWLRASLGYDFQKYTSDLARVIDYDVNQVTLRLAVGY